MPGEGGGAYSSQQLPSLTQSSRAPQLPDHGYATVSGWNKVSRRNGGRDQHARSWRNTRSYIESHCTLPKPKMPHSARSARAELEELSAVNLDSIGEDQCGSKSPTAPVKPVTWLPLLGTPITDLPRSVQSALGFLSKDAKPSEAEIREVSKRLKVSLREALAVCLVGEGRCAKLKELAEVNRGKPLVLQEWLQPNAVRSTSTQLLAAGLLLLHEPADLSLEGCEIEDDIAISAVSQWLAVRTLNLRGISSLRKVDSLQKCKYVQSLDLSDCSELKSVHGLLNCPSLQYIDLSGCTQLDPEELWDLSQQVSVQGGGIVWPSKSMLQNVIQQNRMLRQQANTVLSAARRGVRQQLFNTLAQKNLEGLKRFRESVKRAKALGVDVKAAQEAAYKVKLEILLGPDDNERLRQHSGKSWKMRLIRAAACAGWMGIRPPTGLTLADFQLQLAQQGFPTPSTGYPPLFSCLDTEGTGEIFTEDVELLMNGFLGPATVSAATDFLSALLRDFEDLDQVAEYLLVDKHRLRPSTMCQKLAGKIDAKFLDAAIVAGVVKLLDYRGRAGKLGQKEILSLGRLTSILVYDNVKRICGAMDTTYGSLDAAFAKNSKKNAMSFEDFCNALPGKLQKSEAGAVFMHLSKDNLTSSSLSKAEFGQMMNMPAADNVIEDVQKLYKTMKERFEGADDLVKDSFDFLLKKSATASKGGAKTSDGMSFPGFEAALEEWEFVPSMLSVRELFNVFDAQRRGIVNEDDWQVLDFFEAEELRQEVRNLIEFLVQQHGGCDVAFEQMLVDKRNEQKAQREKRKQMKSNTSTSQSNFF